MSAHSFLGPFGAVQDVRMGHDRIVKKRLTRLGCIW